MDRKTNITVDALPATSKTPVTGEVAKIAVTGTSESGVTTFIVTVKVNDNLDKLKGGMNANGEIEVSNKENILYVPIEAITTINGKSFVYLKGAGSGSTPSGMAKQWVEELDRQHLMQLLVEIVRVQATVNTRNFRN